MRIESIYKRYEPAVEPSVEDNTKCYWFIFSANKLLIKSTDEGCNIPFLKSLEELGILPVRTQYLGTLQGYPCYSAEVPPDITPPEGTAFNDLRSLYGVLDEDIFMLAGKAVQIVAWDQTHQYCGRCGAKTQQLEGERAKKCPECGLICYPRISPAVITAIIKDDKILLAHNKNFKGNMYSLIAGFLEPGETLEDCVRREIQEEVNIRVKNIRYFGSQPWPFPNSLMIGFTAEYDGGELCADGVEISEAGWFDIESLPELPSKLSIARKIIDWYIDRYSREDKNL